MAFDPKYIEWRKSIATLFKKLLYLLVIFGFAYYMASQLNLKAKLLSVNLDFLFSLLLFQVQNLGEIIAYFLFYLPAIINGRSIY